MGIFSSIGKFLGGPIAGALGGLADSSHTNASIGRAGADRIAGFDQSIADTHSLLDPYTKGLGTPAAGALATLLGLGGDSAGAIEGLKQNPVYTALMKNGTDSVLANASATGGLRGGNTEHSLAGVGVDTLAQVYQMMISNLGGAAQLGAGVGTHEAGMLGDANIGRGDAAAKMVLDKIGLGADNKAGIAPSGSVSGGLGNFTQLYQGIQNLFKGGGGQDFGALEGLF